MSLNREWWGPVFWRILHTLAECSGSMKTVVLSNDEADLWTILLKSQAFVMPCTLCKQHYLEWRTNNKIPNLRNVIGEDRKKLLRNWLWKCHNSVNSQSGKETINEDILPTLYKKENISEHVKKCYEMFKIALEQSSLQYEDIKRWKSCIARIRLLYGV
jgi:hypothetical protein